MKELYRTQDTIDPISHSLSMILLKTIQLNYLKN